MHKRFRWPFLALIVVALIATGCSAQEGEGTVRGLLVSTEGAQGDLLLIDEETLTSELLAPGGIGRFSADASEIIFMSLAEGNLEIRIMTIDSRVMTVVPVEGFATWPSLSPDGLSVLYNAVTAVGDSGALSVPMISSVGTGETLTIGDAAEFRVASAASFNGDGSRIAYTESGELFLADPLTGIATRVAMDGWADQAAWSPDGTRIATIVSEKPQEPGELRIVNADDERHATLVADILAFNFSWSPDGDSIAFVDTNTNVDGGDDSGVLSVVSTAGDDRPVARLGEADHWPTWSPDGRELGVTDLDGNVVIVNIDSAERRPINVTGIVTDWR